MATGEMQVRGQHDDGGDGFVIQPPPSGVPAGARVDEIRLRNDAVAGTALCEVLAVSEGCRRDSELRCMASWSRMAAVRDIGPK